MRPSFKDQRIARRAIAELDVATTRRHWDSMFPGQPLVDDGKILAMLHLARTMTPGIPERLRFYSHRWLLDHDLPSFLPDHLRAKAERVYPKVELGVGFAWNTQSSILKPLRPTVEAAVAGAVLEAQADGKLDNPEHVRRRMIEAKERTLKKLVGL